jgi:pimeloyl-ACP methyl ester carboxylesterase/DNA-binding winged helix-turn-helix (wHTH) protein
VSVEPQVFDVLVHLVSNRDRVVEKNELLDHVWRTRFVTESTLTSRIKAVRRAVGDDGQAQRTVRTIHSRGYRFVAEVTEDGDEPARLVQPSPTSAVHQELRFCETTDGARLAFASVGSGPPLVKAANWLTHLRHDWESLVWGHWLRELSVRHRLIHYDERGCGLSDWDVRGASFETWVSDLETVIDAVGVDRVALLGISQGGAVATAYAARHPQRVSRLILYGAFPLGRRKRGKTEEERREADVMLQLLGSGWGRDSSPFTRMFAAQFVPRGSAEQWAAFVEQQRRTASTANAVALMGVSADIDVTALAPLVRAPTLVVHADGDQVVPREQGELLAGLIPGARFVALESDNHVLLADEPAWSVFLAEVDSFLAVPNGAG